MPLQFKERNVAVRWILTSELICSGSYLFSETGPDFSFCYWFMFGSWQTLCGEFMICKSSRQLILDR
uniref:Uncharacterized protein n=1 Tax=Nelumbo nucifera TaxID=4432 RepID=A0A822XN98_NELNU|nr:TPA_asm: hypothetical protein HUJ06_023200 [Nelumbo nucifera]